MIFRLIVQITTISDLEVKEVTLVEGRHSSRVRWHNDHVRLRRGNPYPFDSQEYTRGNLFQMPPFLYRQTEACRYRWTRWSLQQTLQSRKTGLKSLIKKDRYIPVLFYCLHQFDCCSFTALSHDCNEEKTMLWIISKILRPICIIWLLHLYFIINSAWYRIIISRQIA